MTSPRMVQRQDYTPSTHLIKTVDLEIVLNEDDAVVRATLQIEANPFYETVPSSLSLNGDALTLQSIKIDGEALPEARYTVTEHSLTLQAVPAAFTLETVVRIFPKQNTALSGLYRTETMYCTQCEAEGFRRITYFLDRPDVLSLYTTKITADQATCPVLLSNGNLVEKSALSNQRHSALWLDPFRKPCYLFALVAGDFDLLQDDFVTASQKTVALKVYVEKGYGHQASHAMQSLKDAMRWDEVTYGREYDLETYMIVATSDFNMGAMENKGLNIFNTKYILAEPKTATDNDYIHVETVVAHEYFHNWTGNRVTCRDWFQLSLKEGLTIFREHAFAEDLFSRAVMRIRDVRYLREVQFVEDNGPLSHPVRPDAYLEINNFYTTTIYEKGAEVLRMLKTMLGASLFRQGMDLYFNTFDGQAVTIEDFVHTMELVSGVDLTQFRLWYSTRGTPTVSVQADYDAARLCYTLTFHQQLSPLAGTRAAPLCIPVALGLLSASGETLLEQVVLLTKETEVVTFENMMHQPIPSLLRDFSAPIKLQYTYTDEALLFLCQKDTDAFNRFEAWQQYLTRVLLKDDTIPAALFSTIESFLQAALSEAEDLCFIAEMLTLPSEKYLGEQMSIYAVDQVYQARENLLQAIATQLSTQFFAVYEHFSDLHAPYVFSMKKMGERQIKNLCLSYLMRLPQYISLGVAQFQAALNHNMTDTEAALIALSNVSDPARQEALDVFYKTWRDYPLVIDKWLAIQATSKQPGTLAVVKALLHHEAFNIKNPNKVYALIGAFTQRNLVQFHALNGEGYVFLRECVLTLNALNPQIAARMVQPLTTFKRYDKERQRLMREQLKMLLNDPTLSKDVYELASKAYDDK